MNIISIDKIIAEATADAETSSNVNDTCRYVFGSAEGIIYKSAFEACRKYKGNAINLKAAIDIARTAHLVEAIA
jgi:hypothetical protein